MAWLSRLVLKLDAENKAALRHAAFEENVRLALWRIDSTLSNVISLENARPYDSYPSLIQNPPEVYKTVSAEFPTPTLFYFQFEPDGRLVLPETAEIESNQLDQLRREVTKSELLRSIQYTKDIQTVEKRVLTDEPDRSRTMVRTDTSQDSQSRDSQSQNSAFSRPLSNSALPLQSRVDKEVQQKLNVQELNIREDMVTRNDVRALSYNAPRISSSTAGSESTSKIAPGEETKQKKETNQPSRSNKSTEETSSTRAEWVKRSVQQDTNLELMQPVWLNENLYLVRRVFIDGKEYIQGCWLDWPDTRRMMLKLIEDLLPNADLVPLRQKPEEEQTRLLASIPVQLIPGPIPEEPENGWSIYHTSLSIAWIGVLLSTLSVGIVLRRTTELNQRRGAFVSAVTHELRTPLTTFRMYTEMLDEGMVVDDEKKKQYMGTLHREAERLSHLVENVLAYSQLENNRGGADHIGRIRLSELEERITPSLSERARQYGMELIEETDNAARNSYVNADLSAVERILFNLVDNAGKYAQDTLESKIIFSIRLKDSTAVLSIQDYGPGIPKSMQKKLFIPFTKSASDAAHSAPGVGLGLAISRRLARQMHGNLILDKSISKGTRFILTLPVV
jgi:signal transduction histidine kinase